MGTGRYPEGAGDGLPDDTTEETTLSDEEWPVAEQYRVEPHGQPAEQGTIVLTRQDAADAPTARRFPPDLGPGLLAALAGVLLAVLLVPAGFWVASRGEEQAGASNEPTRPTDATQAESAPTSTTTPAPAGVEIPDVTGRRLADARAALEEAELDVRFRRVESERPRDEVIEQESPAAGEDVADGSVVVLDVAAARTVTVPDLTGMRSSEARSRLQALGLRVTQRPVESSRPAGEVVAQAPAAGAEAQEGAVVTLRVSTGPTRIAIPDVSGLDEAAAIRELEAAGFEVAVVDEPTVEPAEDGVVLRQSPRAGSGRRTGSTVTITVGRLSG